MRDKVSGARRWVVKIGSALLTADGRGLDQAAMAVWVDQMVALREAGVELVLVSSGAVAAGMSRLGWSSRPKAVHELQAAAAVGQMGLIRAWESSFARCDQQTAQILVTHDDLSDRKRYLHHVAFLGAAPPKIRDLKIFADLGVLNFGDEKIVDCFADDQPAAPAATDDIAMAIRRIADKGRAAWPLEETVKALSELTSLATEMIIGGAEIPAALKEQMQTFADQLKHTAGETGKEEDVQVKEENDNLKKELADLKASGLAAAKDGIKVAMEGRIPKAKHGLVLELADRLGDAETIELSDEAGAKEKVSSIEVLRRVLESIPKPVAEGREDFGDQLDDGKPLDVSKIVNKY